MKQDKENEVIYPPFEETIPTEIGGYTERRYHTPESQRTGAMLMIAGAVFAFLAVITIIATLQA